MSSKRTSIRRMAKGLLHLSRSVVKMVMLMLVVNGKVAKSESDQLGKDRQECATELSGMATCLPYVSGQSKAPTSDCCTGLKQVLKDSPKCLCLLVKHRNDPSLNLNINATLALSLPHLCHAPASADASHCPALLKLAPNSPEAKEFTDFAKAAAPAPSTSNSSPTSSDKSNGGETSASDGGNGYMLFTPHRLIINGLLFLLAHLLFCSSCHHLFLK